MTCTPSVLCHLTAGWQLLSCTSGKGSSVSPARLCGPAPPVELKYCCFQLVLAVEVLSLWSRCAATFPAPVRSQCPREPGRAGRQLSGVSLSHGCHSPGDTAGEQRQGWTCWGFLGLPSTELVWPSSPWSPGLGAAEPCWEPGTHSPGWAQCRGVCKEGFDALPAYHGQTNFSYV